jgi:choline dehydrogenase-like flavoprotein
VVVEGFVAMVARGLIFGTGLSAGLPMGCVAFLRSRFANGPSPDLVLLFRASGPVPMQYPPIADPGPDGIGYRVALMQPESRGWLRVVSRDTRVAPEIQQNFLSADKDLQIMREGLRMVRTLNADGEVAGFVVLDVPRQVQHDEVVGAELAGQPVGRDEEVQ